MVEPNKKMQRMPGLSLFFILLAIWAATDDFNVGLLSYFRSTATECSGGAPLSPTSEIFLYKDVGAR